MPSVTGGWENFFVAQAGASAALSGLLFVAVSINLTRILQYPHLPGRAAETLVVLLSPLGVATIGLVPGLDLRSLGIGLLLVPPTW
jgi:modulator of FtsH protease